MNHKKLLLCMLMMLTMLLISGCNPEGEKETPAESSSVESSASSASSSAASSAAQEKKTLLVKLYYPNNDGTELIAVDRKVEVKNDDKYTAVVNSLLKGPDDKNLTTIFPKKMKLRSVKLSNGVAKVDFSKDIIKNFVGGSTGEEMLVGSLVNTLTEFPEVKSVQILIEGKTIETLAGHMDLTEPMKRMDSLIKK